MVFSSASAAWQLECFIVVLNGMIDVSFFKLPANFGMINLLPSHRAVNMALPAPLFSSVCKDEAHWSTPFPNYNATMQLLGPPSNAGRDKVARAVADLAPRHPVVIAFILNNDPDRASDTLSPGSLVPQWLPRTLMD